MTEAAEPCPKWRFATKEYDDSMILLGEGAFANVYSGEVVMNGAEDDEDAWSPCAVKQIKEKYLTEPHVVADFRSEVTMPVSS